MILPNQITNHEFTYSKGSYRAEEVDEFLREIAESYDKTFRENGELVKKLGILADKVEEYRAEEDDIRIALLAAQKAGSQLTKDAKDEAEQTVGAQIIIAAGIAAAQGAVCRQRGRHHQQNHSQSDGKNAECGMLAHGGSLLS